MHAASFQAEGGRDNSFRERVNEVQPCTSADTIAPQKCCPAEPAVTSASASSELGASGPQPEGSRSSASLLPSSAAMPQTTAETAIASPVSRFLGARREENEFLSARREENECAPPPPPPLPPCTAAAAEGDVAGCSSATAASSLAASSQATGVAPPAPGSAALLLMAEEEAEEAAVLSQAHLARSARAEKLSLLAAKVAELRRDFERLAHADQQRLWNSATPAVAAVG